MDNVEEKVNEFIIKVMEHTGSSFEDIEDPETKAMIALAIMKLGKS